MDLLAVAAATSNDTAIDPTLLAVLSIFGGVALTALAGLLGAWIQSRREHEKWLREKRLEAFTTSRIYVRRARALIADFREAQRKAAEGDQSAAAKNHAAERFAELKAESNRLLADFAESSTPLTILGPDDVDDAITAFSKALTDNDSDAAKAADKLVVSRMRTALRITDADVSAMPFRASTWMEIPPEYRK